MLERLCSRSCVHNVESTTSLLMKSFLYISTYCSRNWANTLIYLSGLQSLERPALVLHCQGFTSCHHKTKMGNRKQFHITMERSFQASTYAHWALALGESKIKENILIFRGSKIELRSSFERFSMGFWVILNSGQCALRAAFFGICFGQKSL